MKFSIIVPTYNSGKTIQRTIQSVLNQTVEDWELIVIDDNSSDETLNIVNSFSDSRIKVIRKNNRFGVSDSRNRGIAASQGEFLSFLDSDDTWLPNFLEIASINISKGRLWIFSNYHVVNYNNEITESRVVRAGEYNYNDLLTSGNPIGMLTAVISRQIVGDTRFVDGGHEDYKFWIDISRKGISAWNVGEYTAKYLLRADSLSANKVKSFVWTVDILKSESDNLFQTISRTIRYVLNTVQRRT